MSNDRGAITKVSNENDHRHESVAEELPLAAKVAQPLQKDQASTEQARLLGKRASVLDSITIYSDRSSKRTVN